jgi:hypothetical protein
MDIHTAEPLVPEPSLVKVEIAVGKLKSYKSPGTHQIPTKMIRFICSIWNKEELPQQWILYQFIKRVIRLVVIITEESRSYHLPTKFYLTFFWPG